MKQKSILAALATCSALALNAQNQEKPNLVLFLAEDCTYFDIGCYGSTDSQTPNIDKFASEGIRFTNGFQAAPMCSPTRHNLLTGLWPVKTGAHPNHTIANEGTLSMVQQLKPAGYQVALVGKSHVNPESVFPWDLYAPLTKTNVRRMINHFAWLLPPINRTHRGIKEIRNCLIQMNLGFRHTTWTPRRPGRCFVNTWPKSITWTASSAPCSKSSRSITLRINRLLFI